MSTSSPILKKKTPKTSSTKRTTPPITRQRSRHNHDLQTASQKRRSVSQDTDTLYGPSTQSASQPLITLATLESQTENMQRTSPPGPSASPEEESMDTGLPVSACALNLSGILNKSIDGTSEMLRLLEEEEHTSTSLEPKQTNQTFLEDKQKNLKASLIILAKASHHKTFMETCLHAKTPPRTMCLWVEPHIYHSTKDIEREWRDTLVTASLKLLGTLIKHYSKIINEEKQKLESTLNEVTTYLKSIKDKPSRDTETKNWKELKNIAESEAKTVSENLREQRNKKLTQKRERKRRREQSVEDMTPQPKKSFVEALRGLMSEYTDTQPKNGDGPQRGAGNISYRGKGPANGRNYVKKTGPWPPQRR